MQESRGGEPTDHRLSGWNSWSIMDTDRISTRETRFDLPRIERLDLEVREDPFVPRCRHQFMPDGNCFDAGIGHSCWAISVPDESSPDHSRSVAVEGWDASIELPGRIVFDPFFGSLAARVVPWSPRASNSLSDALRGRVRVGRDLRFNPVEYGPFESRPDGHSVTYLSSSRAIHRTRPTDRLCSISRRASVRGEARRKATNSAPVLAQETVGMGCR